MLQFDYQHFYMQSAVHTEVHCKKSEDFMPQESGSTEQSGLKVYAPFHCQHAHHPL